MKIGSPEYGAYGFSQQAIETLTAKGWSNDDLAQFLGVSTNLINDAEKGYIDFVGSLFARLDILVRVIENMESYGITAQDFKTRLADYPPSTIRKFFEDTAHIVDKPQHGAEHLTGQFCNIMNCTN